VVKTGKQDFWRFDFSANCAYAQGMNFETEISLPWGTGYRRGNNAGIQTIDDRLTKYCIGADLGRMEFPIEGANEGHNTKTIKLTFK